MENPKELFSLLYIYTHTLYCLSHQGNYTYIYVYIFICHIHTHIYVLHIHVSVIYISHMYICGYIYTCVYMWRIYIYERDIYLHTHTPHSVAGNLSSPTRIQPLSPSSESTKSSPLDQRGLSLKTLFLNPTPREADLLNEATCPIGDLV